MANLAASLLMPVTPVAPTSAPALVASEGGELFGEMLAEAMSGAEPTAAGETATAFAELSPTGALQVGPAKAAEIPGTSQAASIAGQLQPATVTAEGVALAVSQLPAVPAVAKAVAGLMAESDAAEPTTSANAETTPSPGTAPPRPISRDQLEQALAHYGLISPLATMPGAPDAILPYLSSPVVKPVQPVTALGDGEGADTLSDTDVLTDDAGSPPAPVGSVQTAVPVILSPPVIAAVGAKTDAPVEPVVMDAAVSVPVTPSRPGLPVSGGALPLPISTTVEPDLSPVAASDSAAALSDTAAPANLASADLQQLRPVAISDVAPTASTVTSDATAQPSTPVSGSPVTPVHDTPVQWNDPVRPQPTASTPVGDAPPLPWSGITPDIDTQIAVPAHDAATPAASDALADTSPIASAKPEPIPANTVSREPAVLSAAPAPVTPNTVSREPAILSATPAPVTASAGSREPAVLPPTSPPVGPAQPNADIAITPSPVSNPLSGAAILSSASREPSVTASAAVPTANAGIEPQFTASASPKIEPAINPAGASPVSTPLPIASAMPAAEVAVRFGNMLGAEPAKPAEETTSPFAGVDDAVTQTATPTVASPIAADRPAVTAPTSLTPNQPANPAAPQTIQTPVTNPAAPSTAAQMPAEIAAANPNPLPQAQAAVASPAAPVEPKLASVIQTAAPTKPPRRAGDPVPAANVTDASADDTAPSTGGSAKPVATAASIIDSATADLGAPSDDAATPPQTPVSQRADARPAASGLAAQPQTANPLQQTIKPFAEAVTTVVAKTAEGVTAAAQRFVERMRGDQALPTDDLASSLQTAALTPANQPAQLIQPAVQRETQAMPQQPPVPLQQVAQEIVRQADKGMTSFEIRLNPVDLGGMDVRLDFNENGEARAHIAVERRDTLELLARDQRQIEKTLRDAGYEARDGSVSLSLKQGNTGDRQSAPDRNPDLWRENRAASNDTSDQDRVTAPRLEAYRPRRDAVLDVRI